MPQGIFRREPNRRIGEHALPFCDDFGRFRVIEKGNQRLDRRIADGSQGGTGLLAQHAILQQHDQVGNDARIAELAERRRRRFLDKSVFADNTAGRRSPILPNSLPLQRVQHRSQCARIADHAERRNSMPLHCSILHRLDQGVDSPWIADLAQSDRGIFAHGTIRIFQRGNQDIDDFGVPHPRSADLIVGRHATECAGSVTPNHIIFILETFDQGIDGRLADRDERGSGCLSHRFRRITEEFAQSRDRSRIADLAQRLCHRTLHGAVTISTDEHEGLDGFPVLYFATGFRGMFTDTPPLILQCRDQAVDDDSAHRGHGRHDIVSHIHDGIVKQNNERFYRFRPPDPGHATACMSAYSPILVSTGPDQRVQRGGIGEFGKCLGCFFAGRVVDILECF